MKIYVLFATVVAFTYAAPMSELPHPSPVNPNVLVELKPAEKIIFITDPKEMAKFKRETQQLLYPTVLPSVENNHHRAKREHQPGPQTKHRDPLPLQKPQPPNKPSVKRNRREVEPVKVTQTLPAANSGHIVVEVYQKPQILPVTQEPVPQILESISQKPNGNDNKQEQPEVTTEKPSRPQGLPAIFSPSKKQKRDVLEPSVSKLDLSEDAPKDSSSEKQTHACKTEDLTHDQIFKTQSQHKRDIPVPLVSKHQHPEESPKEENEKENNEAKKEVKLENHQDLHQKQEQEGFQKPQVLPEILKESFKETQQHKRDIPVPLVPKHHHPEESLKDDKEEVSSQSHHIQEHVIQESFQKPQVLPAILKESEIQQHKRDIPVPLIQKHRHPEESLNSENREKEIHDDRTKLNSEIHHTEDGFQKPQTLPAILKESSVETQHKRDISPNEPLKDISHVQEDIQKGQTQPETFVVSNDQQHKPDATVPVAENHQHQEELPKVNHHLSQTQHIPQTLPAHNNHMLTVQNHQHIFPTQLTNPENHVTTIPIIHKFQPKQHNEYTPHFHQRLTSENHEHAALATTQPAYNQEQVVPLTFQEHIPNNLQSPQVLPTNLRNSQILPTHNQEHVEPTNLQKSQISHQEKLETVPAVSKETTESTAQNKRDVLASPEVAVQSHKQQVEEEHNNQANSNPDEVQVEDLSKPGPLHQPHLHHVQLTYSEHKPNILDDHLVNSDLSSSTTEHPAIRHRPVSVAELFAKVHDN